MHRPKPKPYLSPLDGSACIQAEALGEVAGHQRPGPPTAELAVHRHWLALSKWERFF